MANQIKKKYIEDDAIDGGKLLLLPDQTLRKDDGAGGEVDVIAVLEAADTTLQSNIDAEASSRESADTTLQSNIDAEASARAAADTTLQSNIDAEASSRESADTTLQSNINAEASSRESADTTLQSNIDAEKARIDAILSASEADKDSFAEIVTLINSVDTENDTAFAGYVLSNDAALAQEVTDRQAGDTAIKEYKPEQVVYVSKNGLDTNAGSEHLPFLTLGAALASISDASPTKRYAIRVSAGTYVETNLALKPNVFIVGEGAKENVRIDSVISLDSSFSGSDDNRSGFANALLLKSCDFDWDTATSEAGKLYFSQVVFGSTVSMNGYNNATAQAQFADCQIFGKLTVSGINISVFHNNICWGDVDLNQHPNGGMATIFNAVGGTISGKLTATTTATDFNRRCSAFLKSCFTGSITIDGASSYVDVTNDSLPSAGATITNSGNLVRLNDEGLKKDLSNLSYPTAVNQPIMPANSNATNLGDWGKQWFYNFAYVHGSSGSDLYLISSMQSYDAAGDDVGRTIYIQADSYGLKEDVDGGDVSISTSAVSGTGTRGKISLNGREVDVSDQQIKNLADGTDATDAVTKQQLDVEKGRIDAILLASEADKDSFAEIVTLINSVDTENDSAFAGYVLSNDAALAQEVSDRQSGDSALSARLDVLEAQEAEEVFAYADFASFPATGEDSKLYVAKDTSLLYHWKVDQYVLLSSKANYEKESFTADATMVTNGYVDLAHQVDEKSLMLHVGRLAGFVGEDYTLSVVGGVTRVTFAGSFASGGAEAVAAGDKIKVSYSY